MGLDNKVARMLISKVPSASKLATALWKKNEEQYNLVQATFKKELEEVLQVGKYSIEALEQVLEQNDFFGSVFTKMLKNDEQRQNVLGEIDRVCKMRLEYEQHTEKFSPNVYVFVYGKHINTHMLYCDGIITDMVETLDSRSNTQWLATCMRKGGAVVEEVQSDDIDTYLEKNDEEFPKWLKDLPLKEPKYFPK